MKNKFFAAVILSVFSLGKAQDKKNIIKTNLGGYVFRSFNLTYERGFTKYFSVNVGFSSMSKGDVPFLNSFVGDFENDIFNIQMSNTSFTIEPRFYLGKKYNSGFYFAPYYRYTKMKFDNIDYEYSYTKADNSRKNIVLNMAGDISANSAGLMIGSQWFLGKKDNWVLDLWLTGGHYGSAKGNLYGISNQPLDAEDQNALRNDIKDVDVPVIKYETTVNSNGAQVKINGPWAGLRSGLSFGYRF